MTINMKFGRMVFEIYSVQTYMYTQTGRRMLVAIFRTPLAGEITNRSNFVSACVVT